MAAVTLPIVDTIVIPGCNYIYAPRGNAGEYAPLAANPYRDAAMRAPTVMSPCLANEAPGIQRWSKSEARFSP
jgi:hypothetical protein